MHERNRMTDKDKENIKRNQKEILELKNAKIGEKLTRGIKRQIIDQVEKNQSVNLKTGQWKSLWLRNRNIYTYKINVGRA